MLYHSTNNPSAKVSLQEAVLNGLAPDGGLYMPDSLPWIPMALFNNIAEMTCREIGYVVAHRLFGEDIEPDKLKDIIYDTLNFDIPVRQVEENIYALEVFEGPTMAVNDVSARFMAGLAKYLLEKRGSSKPLNIIVATSGDTGSAVANALHSIEGVQVYILYPRGRVNRIRESQFATLGDNIHAIEVDGSYNDCVALIKQALVDNEITEHLDLTSGNSINLARFMPQMLYFFWAYSQISDRLGPKRVNGHLVFSIPRGNLGNISSAVVASKIGLPAKRFISAAYEGDSFISYLKTGTIPEGKTAPTNLPRLLDVSKGSRDEICKLVEGHEYPEWKVKDGIADLYNSTGYLMSPKSAKAYLALKESIQPGEIGVFLATTHPAKFREDVEDAIGHTIELPATLSKTLDRPIRNVHIPATFSALKRYLLNLRR